jgi:hypothetical protein
MNLIFRQISTLKETNNNNLERDSMMSIFEQSMVSGMDMLLNDKGEFIHANFKKYWLEIVNE